MDTTFVRNFSIIAHIDHGKSTLADRFLEITETVPPREMKDQILDNMDLERERGITIKSHPIQMVYRHADGHRYTMNLLDTPGHVDFTYEVSRSLAACEGAVLLVDAAQGVEAQTVSHALLALEHNLTVIPVLNKIDLPTAQVEEVSRQVMELTGCTKEEILQVSAKIGTGVNRLMGAIVERIPPPPDNARRPLRALIFDSTFDAYRGAIPYVRVFDGAVEPGEDVQFMSHGGIHEVAEVGHFGLGRVPVRRLVSGDVGYLVAGVKDLGELKVGDTVTSSGRPASVPLPGYREIKPMIFSGLYPADSGDYSRLRDSIERLRLN
ncbi:MAG: GTP-binding protein, partial [Fidelibacterota bacterium]